MSAVPMLADAPWLTSGGTARVLKLLNADGNQLIAADDDTSGVRLSTSPNIIHNSNPVLLPAGTYQIQVGRTEKLPPNEDAGYKLTVFEHKRAHRSVDHGFGHTVAGDNHQIGALAYR
jgi:hypothetical protein